MDHIQILTISYECEASLGNSLNLKDMTKEFLRVFLKKTSALYGVIVEFESAGGLSILNSVGKDEFWESILCNTIDMNKKYTLIDMVKDFETYKVLYIPLNDYYLAFVYSSKNNLDIKIVANVFASLRNKIEIGLKASIEHERVELALLGNNDGLWDWNLVDNTIYFSPRFKEMLGYKYDEFKNEFYEWENRVHPDDLQKAFEDIKANISGKTDFYENIHRLKHKNGTWVWILDRGKTFFDENKKAIRMLGTHTDITQEKEMQLKFAHQAQIIEQIHDSVISTDLDGKIISFNRGSELLLEYSADEIIGKHITTIYLEEDFELLQKNIEILKQEGECQSVVRLVKKSKKIIDAHLSLSLLKDENGTAIGMVGYSRDITKEKEAQSKLIQQKEILKHQAYHDALTGLPNRTLFKDRLQRSINKSKRDGYKVALFFIDLDYFKEINDSLGHDVGDMVLKEISNRLSSTIRAEDTLARLGGDEFTIIMESINKEQDAVLLAKKVLDVLKKSIVINQHVFYISASIGISLFPEDGDSYETLLKYADAAMYRAKKEGRNNFQFYSSDMTELAFERMTMEVSLRNAIQKDEFVVYYQMQVDAQSEKIIGFEALVRWQHPSDGLIYPDRFIPLAEETGLIIAIDRLVMKKAMNQMHKWKKDGFGVGKLALNISAKELNQKDFTTSIEQIVDETKFDVKDLELEVTESQIMINPDRAIKRLDEISKMGIELAIDDFGTGYSSLSYLKKLPIDKLKIDKSFVIDLPFDEDDVGITKAVISLAKSLNLKVIAEGVETQEQKDFLLKNGCNFIQGYFYSKPLPAYEVEKLLKKGY